MKVGDRCTIVSITAGLCMSTTKNMSALCWETTVSTRVAPFVVPLKGERNKYHLSMRNAKSSFSNPLLFRLKIFFFSCSKCSGSCRFSSNVSTRNRFRMQRNACNEYVLYDPSRCLALSSIGDESPRRTPYITLFQKPTNPCASIFKSGVPSARSNLARKSSDWYTTILPWAVSAHASAMQNTAYLSL